MRDEQWLGRQRRATVPLAVRRSAGKVANALAKRCLFANVADLRRLEVGLESELILPWCVVWIGLRNSTECRVSEACAATAISDVEIRRVGDIKALGPELHLQTLRDGEVLEDRQINMAEVGPEQRVSMGGSNGSKGLWGES